jgi:hypothetical protein
MLIYEEIARIRVKEAIQQGLQSQYIQRNLPARKKPVSKAALMVFCLALLLAITLLPALG